MLLPPEGRKEGREGGKEEERKGGREGRRKKEGEMLKSWLSALRM